MASSLSNLINNLAEGIHKVKYKYGHNDRYKDCDSCLGYTDLKDDFIGWKCSCCNNDQVWKLKQAIC